MRYRFLVCVFATIWKKNCVCEIALGVSLLYVGDLLNVFGNLLWDTVLLDKWGLFVLNTASSWSAMMRFIISHIHGVMVQLIQARGLYCFCFTVCVMFVQLCMLHLRIYHMELVELTTYRTFMIEFWIKCYTFFLCMDITFTGSYKATK